MGNGASRYDLPPNNIFIQLPGSNTIEKLVYGRYSSSRDLQEMIALACGLPRTTLLTLKDSKGTIVGIGPDMPQNTRETVYKVEVKAIAASFQTGNNATPGTTVTGGTAGGKADGITVMNGGGGANGGVLSSPGGKNQTQLVQQVLLQVSEQFNKAFQMDELRSALETKIRLLENRMDPTGEGLKSIEIDRCKKEIVDLRNQMHSP